MSLQICHAWGVGLWGCYGQRAWVLEDEDAVRRIHTRGDDAVGIADDLVPVAVVDHGRGARQRPGYDDGVGGRSRRGKCLAEIGGEEAVVSRDVDRVDAVLQHVATADGRLVYVLANLEVLSVEPVEVRHGGVAPYGGRLVWVEVGGGVPLPVHPEGEVHLRWRVAEVDVLLAEQLQQVSGPQGGVGDEGNDLWIVDENGMAVLLLQARGKQGEEDHCHGNDSRSCLPGLHLLMTIFLASAAVSLCTRKV